MLVRKERTLQSGAGYARDTSCYLGICDGATYIPVRSSGGRMFEGMVKMIFATSWASLDFPVPELWTMGIMFLYGAPFASFFIFWMLLANLLLCSPTYGAFQEILVAGYISCQRCWYARKRTDTNLRLAPAVSLCLLQ